MVQQEVAVEVGTRDRDKGLVGPNVGPCLTSCVPGLYTCWEEHLCGKYKAQTFVGQSTQGVNCGFERYLLFGWLKEKPKTFSSILGALPMFSSKSISIPRKQGSHLFCEEPDSTCWVKVVVDIAYWENQHVCLLRGTSNRSNMVQRSHRQQLATVLLAPQFR